MYNDYYEECPFREMQGMPMGPGYMAGMQGQPMFQPGAMGMPVMQQGISAGMPSMAPGGTTAAPPFPTPQMLQGMEQADFEMAPGAPVQQDVNYTQGYLRTQIGKRMLVSFLIGTNTYQDRTGVLERVGISYIILREPEGTELLCDIYSIKFVRIFSEQAQF
jgi:hypothetical protein